MPLGMYYLITFVIGIIATILVVVAMLIIDLFQ
jgi:hypothetical protein